MRGSAPADDRPWPRGQSQAWFAQDAAAVAAALETDADQGLTQAEAAARLTRHGPNELTGEKPPSVWQIAIEQLREPMNIMLIAVTAVSFAIGEVPTGIIVALLILLNLVLGSRQELKARASVDALAKMQVPQTRVLRDGHLVQVPAREVVPGDIVEVEAGDIVPADGRIIRSATLETQEAALTGESAPVAKDAAVLAGPDVALGDRTDMLFQNTSVTRGTGAMIVTATGMETEMGRIATMLTSVSRVRSPLQKELDSLTKVLGVIAWTAVAFIVVVGLIRGLNFDDLRAAGHGDGDLGDPDRHAGLRLRPALARRQAARRRPRGRQEPHRRRDARSDERDQHRQDRHPDDERDDGLDHLRGRGVVQRHRAGLREDRRRSSPSPAYRCRTSPGWRSGSRSTRDATVGDDGAVIGDPTEAALVVLAAKLGVNAEETRRAYPRLAAVPFDSAYKFMATFHRVTVDGAEHVIELVKGGPDVVFARCTQAGGPLSGSQVPIADVRADLDAANVRMGEQGLRVLAFAARLVADDELDAMVDDPMSLTQELAFVGMAGMIDPLRAEAKDAVTTALKAGIDVRMITGDNPITAGAIGESLGLGPGAISGTEFQALSDEEVVSRLPQLHVFGRVTPEDKLRLARLMQGEGQIVAATGDAVNDAVALKQADIGVAMGSGSEVTKQAARMILTDDNFGTLVHAVELGRRVYDKVVAYVRYQMTQLLALVMLFVAASAFDINDGVALTPLMVLYLLFFATAAGVVVIAVDPGDPDVMSRPPRDPKLPIANRAAIVSWVIYAAALFVAALLPLVIGPDDPKVDAAERLDDDDLRRHGAGHGLQRARPTAASRPAGSPRRSSERSRSRSCRCC